MSEKKSRKSTLAQRYQSSKRVEARWDECPDQLVASLVNAVSAARCAVLFGHTRDGGALALTFFDGSEKFNEYHPIDDYLEEWLRGQVEFWVGYADEVASPKPVDRP